MKLIYAKQGIELRLDENQVNTLVLENPAIFSEFLQNLISQLEGNEGELFLSEGDKIYPISKTVAFLANPLSVDCNEKKIITKLYKELEDNVKAHLLQPDGSYEKVDKRGKVLVNSQDQFCEEAIEMAKACQESKDPAVTRIFQPIESSNE